MPETPSIDHDRDQIENRIVKLAENVPIRDSDSDLEWLYSQELYEFIDSWSTLVKYYQEHSDIDIGVEVISEYVYYARILRRLMCNIALDPTLRQKAEDQMRDLDSAMDEVIKEAVSHLNN